MVIVIFVVIPECSCRGSPALRNSTKAFFSYTPFLCRGVSSPHVFSGDQRDSRHNFFLCRRVSCSLGTPDTIFSFAHIQHSFISPSAYISFTTNSLLIIKFGIMIFNQRIYQYLPLTNSNCIIILFMSSVLRRVNL